MSSQLQINEKLIKSKVKELVDYTNSILDHEEICPYIPLEYIQGDGNAYINTRQNMSNSKYFTLKVTNNTSVFYGKIFGIFK